MKGTGFRPSVNHATEGRALQAEEKVYLSPAEPALSLSKGTAELSPGWSPNAVRTESWVEILARKSPVEPALSLSKGTTGIDRDIVLDSGNGPEFPSSYTTKLDETMARGNVYNPFILWSRLLPSSRLPRNPGRMRKTLLNPRNQVRRMGLQRVWVP